MTNENILTEEQLEKVTGGDSSFSTPTFTGKVDKYKGIIGENYYFVNGSYWIYGTLLESFEKDMYFGTTERNFRVRVLINYMWKLDFNYETIISGDAYTMYTGTESPMGPTRE